MKMKISYHACMRHVSINEHFLDAMIKSYQELNLQKDGLPLLIDDQLHVEDITQKL